ncbi:MAG TPA: hypothetical protein VNO32_62755, partial [Candidatus Acidoferrum sp.]|nr:hypothetical protein [Candidatus Acidoferrum sp.]
AGALDMNLNSGVQSNLSVTSGSSSYHVTSDQRGCMVVTTSAGTQNYRFSLGNITSGVASTGHVIGFDTTGPFTTGIMRKQTPAAFGTGSSQVSGNYAFGVSSAQNTANSSNGVFGGSFGAVGVFDFSTGSITGGEVDFNNNGQLDGSALNTNWPASPVGFSSGSYTISSTNGRGTLSFTPNATGATTVTTVIYVVSSTDVLVLCTDLQVSNSIFAGEMLKQSGTLSGTPLSGAYVGYQSGLSSTAGASRTTLLLLNASGNSITGNQLRNDAGSFQSKAIGAGITYSVTAQGRVIIPPSTGNNPPIFYLVNANQAFFLNQGSSVETGFLQSQTGGPFTNTSASGTYAFGEIDPQDANSSDNLGLAIFASPNINVTEDDNSNGSQTLGGTMSFTYSVDSTGLGMIPSSGSSCTISASSTTCQTVFYIISPTKAVIMDTQSSNPKVQLGDK